MSAQQLQENPAADPAAFARILLKLSGEAFADLDLGFGIDPRIVNSLADQLRDVTRELGVQVAVVVGGGNMFRGVEISANGVSRVTGDALGMLATVMNALVLEAALERAGAPARTLSALAMPAVCETYSRQRALRHLGKMRIVLLAAGTGNPFFTTDTAAVLRASELNGEAVLKATNVDGVYSADPKKDAGARRFERLTHQEAIERDLKVMDATAFALARENRIPIIVFSIREEGAIRAALEGKGHATYVWPS